jgi:hypothetical protein
MDATSNNQDNPPDTRVSAYLLTTCALLGALALAAVLLAILIGALNVPG